MHRCRVPLRSHGLLSRAPHTLLPHIVPRTLRPLAHALPSLLIHFPRCTRSTVVSAPRDPLSIHRLSQPLICTSFSAMRRLSHSTTVAPTSHRRLVRRALKLALLLVLLLLALIYMYFPEVSERTQSSFHTAVRFSRAVWAATLISIDYKWSLSGLTPEQRDARISEVHLRSAMRLRELFKRNAGIFIKAGQHIAALDYLVPEEYTSTMRVFQDHAPHLPLDEVRPMLERDLGAPLEILFESFDAVPIASASLAQVHRARLRKGAEEGGHAMRDVAVKVQFPGLQERCKGDVSTIGFIVEVVSRVFPEFQLKWLVDEFNRNLPLELDFMHEARNSERVARNFANDSTFATPRIVWPLTRQRVLTMEFVTGFKPNDLAALKAHKISPESVVALLGRVFNEQVFTHGFVHCDPHPGNVLLRPRSDTGTLQLVLLDHGLYRDLGAPFVNDYARLWLSLIRGDEPQVVELCRRLAPGSDHRVLASMLTARAWASAETKLDSAMTDTERDIIRNNTARVAEITGILAKVPSDLLLLFKTNDLLRSLNNDLGLPHTTASYELMLRYCQANVNKSRANTDRSWSTWALNKRDSLVLEAKLRLAPIFLWLLGKFFTSNSNTSPTKAVPPLPVQPLVIVKS